MKRFSGLFLALTLILSGAAAFADTDPSYSESYSYAGTGSASAKSDSAVLGQFPRAEIAPFSQTQTVQSMGAQASSSLDFPKVKTNEDEMLAKRFAWWPSDATPAPYKDENRSGYWWWPTTPGQTKGPWGNQGFVYVKKLIFDYKSTPGEQKPSLVIKKIIKNVKVYFDYNKAELRDDARDILSQALYTLEKNPNADILITGNADTRGSEDYNQKLGERRASSVEQYFKDRGFPEDRIRILSRGKLDAMAPRHDLVGMQKDRNAQFMIAEVEEVMIPASQAGLYGESVIEEKKEIESSIRVEEKEYTIKSGDTLWAIAEREYGDGRQWTRIYEFNKDVISNPNRPKKGVKIRIPIE